MVFDSAPLDATVEDRIREKISRNQYIDFASLLRNDSSESVFVTTVDDNGGAMSQALLMAKGEKKAQLSYTQWLKAFYVFATVWCKI